MPNENTEGTPIEPSEISLKLVRKVNGRYQIDFTNLWLPRDVHHAQRAINIAYQDYRRKLILGLKKSKKKKSQEEAEHKVQLRIVKSEDTAALETPEPPEPPEAILKQSTKQPKFYRKELEHAESK